MSGRTSERTLYLALETGGYATDPSANGSGYRSVPAEDLGDLPEAVTQLEQSIASDSPYPAEVVAGPEGPIEISFKLAPWGLQTEAGDGDTASAVADDLWDDILVHVLQTRTSVDGEGVSTGSTTTNLVLDTDSHSVYDLLPYFTTGLTRAEWSVATVDAADGSYTVSPAFVNAPVDAGEIRGTHVWAPPSTQFAGGYTFSGVYKDSNIGTYWLGGGRITKLSLNAVAGQRLLWDVTVRFDRSSEDASAKSSLPTPITVPPITGLQCLRSPVAFNGTRYAVQGFNFDFGITAAPVKDTAGLNGRGGDEMMSLAPMLEIMPLRTDALRELQRAASRGPALLQLGGGSDPASAGYLNTMAIYLGNGQIVGAAPSDDEGYARQTIRIAGKRIRSGDAMPFLKVARA